MCVQPASSNCPQHFHTALLCTETIVSTVFLVCLCACVYVGGGSCIWDNVTGVNVLFWRLPWQPADRQMLCEYYNQSFYGVPDFNMKENLPANVLPLSNLVGRGLEIHFSCWDPSTT